MKIEKNAFVALGYELRTGSASGEVIEKTDTATPLRFVYGTGRMLPMFEEKIASLQAGEKFEFQIKCADAYGEVNPEAIVDIPKNVFVINGELRSDLLEVGNHVPMMGEGGRRIDGIVLEVTDDSVKMDFNHPLAGDDLYFSGEIFEVREATAEELIGEQHGCCSGGCGGCSGGCDSGCDSGCDGGCDGGCCSNA